MPAMVNDSRGGSWSGTEGGRRAGGGRGHRGVRRRRRPSIAGARGRSSACRGSAMRSTSRDRSRLLRRSSRSGVHAGRGLARRRSGRRRPSRRRPGRGSAIASLALSRLRSPRRTVTFASPVAGLIDGSASTTTAAALSRSTGIGARRLDSSRIPQETTSTTASTTAAKAPRRAGLAGCERAECDPQHRSQSPRCVMRSATRSGEGPAIVSTISPSARKTTVSA